MTTKKKTTKTATTTKVATTTKAVAKKTAKSAISSMVHAPAVPPKPEPVYEHDGPYLKFLESVRKRITSATSPNQASPPDPIFTTDAKPEFLWKIFLRALPKEIQQQHNCRACRFFIERFGGLVQISMDGRQFSAIWIPEAVPVPYKKAAMALYLAAQNAKITGVFRSNDETWGHPRTGLWKHLAGFPASEFLSTSKLATADQEMAVNREEYGMIQRALAEHTPETVRRAIMHLESGRLYRAEKVLAHARWFADVHRVAHRPPLVWRAVATAPTGWCHVSSSVLGALLRDIVMQWDVEEIVRLHNERMDPGQYQRPQSPPASGNIDQAEKVFEKLGIASALKRRYACDDDIIERLWEKKPVDVKLEANGIFASIRIPYDYPNLIVRPERAVSFAHFRAHVLPNAAKIEYHVPMGWRNLPLCGYVTAVDPLAEPIIRWDGWQARNGGVGGRNPVSWYLYNGGSSAASWNLAYGTIVNVRMITLRPSSWFGRPAPDIGEGALFVLDGCRDRNGLRSLHLFPEILRTELHPVRATIEAFSNRKELGGTPGWKPSVAGIMLAPAMGIEPSTYRFRVTDRNGIQMTYLIDWWD